MVATSKMRRAQDRMTLARPYAEKIRAVIGNLHAREPGLPPAVHGGRAEAKNVGFIVISSDRGLAGGLNANVFTRDAAGCVKEWQAQGRERRSCA